MSLAVNIYYCSSCDYHQSSMSLWGGHEYVLPNGIRLPIRKVMGWCDTCKAVTYIENLSTATRISDYREAQRGLYDKSQSGMLTGIWSQSKHNASITNRNLSSMEDAIDAIEMLTTRQSPPRCLKCGCTQVHVPESSTLLHQDNDSHRTWIKHPDCSGEILWREDDGGLRIAMTIPTQSYTPEGELIARPEESDEDSFDCIKPYDDASESNIKIRELIRAAWAA